MLIFCHGIIPLDKNYVLLFLTARPCRLALKLPSKLLFIILQLQFIAKASINAS
jgi:hypothetical protein